jgi:MFS family permease
MSGRDWEAAVQRVRVRVVLAAGAGLGSLALCSGAVAVIVLLFIASIDFGWIGSSLNPAIFWVGLVILIILAAAGLSLPARALGAKRDHVTNTAVLSVLGLCAFVFFVVGSLVNPYFGVPLALMAIVATPVVGSLVAIREDYRLTVGLVRATVIAAVAIYCASLLAFWWVYAQDTSVPYYLCRCT